MAEKVVRPLPNRRLRPCTLARSTTSVHLRSILRLQVDDKPSNLVRSFVLRILYHSFDLSAISPPKEPNRHLVPVQLGLFGCHRQSVDDSDVIWEVLWSAEARIPRRRHRHRLWLRLARHDYILTSDTHDFLARIVARMSVSVSASWNASLTERTQSLLVRRLASLAFSTETHPESRHVASISRRVTWRVLPIGRSSNSSLCDPVGTSATEICVDLVQPSLSATLEVDSLLFRLMLNNPICLTYRGN